MNTKKIFLTLRPYIGFFKYKDQFSIYPVSIELKGIEAHIPAIIEFKTAETKEEYFEDEESNFSGLKDPIPSSMVQQIGDTHKYDEILRLLSLLTNYHHFTYSCKQAWFSSLAEFPPKVTWGQELAPPIELSGKECNVVEKTESFEYYKLNSRLSGSSNITYPDSINDSLDKYFGLADEHKRVIDKSMRLFVQGLELRNKMPSLAIVAFVSAIENLVSYDNNGKEDTCKCGEIKYGVTRKFKTFVKQYLTASTEKEKNEYVDKIYDTRSKIVHAGGLHIYDLDQNFWDMWGKEELKDYLFLQNIESITRICLINWYKNK